MPRQAPRPCSAPGCPALVTAGAYCPDHAPQYVSPHEAGRGTASQRGYGARWRRLRQMVLATYPICADPYGEHRATGQVVAATDVDHITARSAGGADTLANLQALCHACHSRKTVTADGGFGRKKDSVADGGGAGQISRAFEVETARRAFRTHPRNARRGVHGRS
jgi:5-methylcytosine-specific restriction protein A